MNSTGHNDSVLMDAKVLITIGSAAASAIIAMLMVLHSFGVFTYETRISVIETKLDTYKDRLDEVYRSILRVDRNVDEVNRHLVGKPPIEKP